MEPNKVVASDQDKPAEQVSEQANNENERENGDSEDPQTSTASVSRPVPTASSSSLRGYGSKIAASFNRATNGRGELYSSAKLMSFIDFTGLVRPENHLTADDDLDRNLFNVMQRWGQPTVFRIDKPLTQEVTLQRLTELMDAHNACQEELVSGGAFKYMEALRKMAPWTARLYNKGSGSLSQTVDQRYALVWKTIDGLRRARVAYLSSLSGDQPELPASPSPFLLSVHQCTLTLKKLGPAFQEDAPTRMSAAIRVTQPLDLGSKTADKRTARQQALELAEEQMQLATRDAGGAAIAAKWQDFIDLVKRKRNPLMGRQDSVVSTERYETWRTWARGHEIYLPQLEKPSGKLPTSTLKNIKQNLDWRGMLPPKGHLLKFVHETRKLFQSVHEYLGDSYSAETVNQYFCDILQECIRRRNVIALRGRSHFWQEVKYSDALTDHLKGIDEVLLKNVVQVFLDATKRFLEWERQERQKALNDGKPFVATRPSALGQLVRHFATVLANTSVARDPRIRATAPAPDQRVGSDKVLRGEHSVTLHDPATL